MFGYQVVKFGLCELRLITFIMTMSAITQHVDENILTKFLTILNRKVCAEGYCLGIIAIHVKHGCIYNLGDIRTVNTGACIIIIGGKTNLVINHEVNRSSSSVAR